MSTSAGRLPAQGRPRALDYDDKRFAILKAAARSFAEGGYDGTSMARIAAACGVSKPLLYHYYDSKEALLFDILRAHLEELVAAVRAVDRKALTPFDHLAALCGALLARYEDADAEHKVQVSDLGRLPPAEQEALKDLERILVEVFAAAIMRLHPGLRGRPHLLKPLTMSLFGMLNWHFMWFRPTGPMSRQGYARFAAEIIAGGAARIAGSESASAGPMPRVRGMG